MDLKTKGNKVEIATFNIWGKGNIIGHKTEEVDSKKMVNFIWCKVCNRYKNDIMSRLKGKSKILALAFITGTNVVMKYQVRIALIRPSRVYRLLHRLFKNVITLKLIFKNSKKNKVIQRLFLFSLEKHAFFFFSFYSK